MNELIDGRPARPAVIDKSPANLPAIRPPIDGELIRAQPARAKLETVASVTVTTGRVIAIVARSIYAPWRFMYRSIKETLRFIILLADAVKALLFLALVGGAGWFIYLLITHLPKTWH